MTRTRTPLLAAALAGTLALAVAPGAGAEETTPATTAVGESTAQEVTPAGEGSPAEKPFSKDDANPSADQPVAAGLVALPAVLTLDGTTYYLNADGATYVTDMGRINAAPTAQETENTKAMLAKNSAEVGRQAIAEAKAGGQKPSTTAAAPAAPAPATTTASAPAPAAPVAPAAPAASAPTAPAERGMAAQTGSNTAARALFALVIASVMGAAVYASARRSLL